MNKHTRLIGNNKIAHILSSITLTFMFLHLCKPTPVLCNQYMQVAGLIDVRTTFSDGSHTIDQLAKMAKERGFGALFVTDHDRMTIAYGLPPFRNLIKKTEHQNAINLKGADQYLQAVRETQSRHPDLIIIPGSETAAFYYWSGNPFSDQFTVHDHEKRLLTIGMDKADDYQEMPILHNRKPFSIDHFGISSLLFFTAAILAGTLLIWKGPLRIMGIVCCPLALLLLFNSDPLKTSPFDAYSGPQGIAPYQLVIDYVNNKGGMTFWNYPETRSGIRKMGPAFVSTKPYPSVLQESKGYTGFAAVYGENVTVTDPGNLWDITLIEYCRGLRMWPTWGIATADYHGEGPGNATLGTYPTIFFVPEKTKAAILKSMQTGKMYACQANYPLIPRLDDFSVSSADGQKKGISGDEITINTAPKIRIALSTSGIGTPGPVKVRLIRAGHVIAFFEGKLPMVIEHEDTSLDRGEKTFYRMDMRGGAGIIVSNPIFVTFNK